MESNSIYNIIKDSGILSYKWEIPQGRKCLIGEEGNENLVRFSEIIHSLDKEIDNSSSEDKVKLKELRGVLNKVKDVNSLTSILGAVSRIFGDSRKLHDIENKLVKLEKIQEREEIYKNYWFEDVRGERTVICKEVDGDKFFKVTFKEVFRSLKAEFEKMKKLDNNPDRIERLRERIYEAKEIDEFTEPGLMSKLFGTSKELDSLKEEFDEMYS